MYCAYVNITRSAVSKKSEIKAKKVNNANDSLFTKTYWHFMHQEDRNFAYQRSEQHFVYCLNLQMYQPSPPVEKIFFYPRVASAEVANDTDDS